MRVRIGRWMGLVAMLALGCDGGDGDDTSATACDAEGLDGCEYESPGLDFTVRNTTATDEATGRVLPLRIRVPEGDGPFAIVIYSHGGGLSDTGHVSGAEWAEALASHGYVTINIGHSLFTSVEQAEAFCPIGAIPETECNLSIASEESGVVALVKGQDIRGVIDELPVLAGVAEGLGGPEVDLDKIAVIGWSAGSRATMAASGLSFYPSPSAPLYSENDARIVTSVMFSPTGPGFGGFFADETSTSWDTLDGPTLSVTGENDVKPDNTALTGPIRRAAYEHQPADGARRLLYSNLPVGQGGHGTYNLADLDSTDEDLSRFSRAMLSAVRAFLDDTLEDDAQAHAWLESDDAHVLAGDADWESK